MFPNSVPSKAKRKTSAKTNKRQAKAIRPMKKRKLKESESSKKSLDEGMLQNDMMQESWLSSFGLFDDFEWEEDLQ